MHPALLLAAAAAPAGMPAQHQAASALLPPAGGPHSAGGRRWPLACPGRREAAGVAHRGKSRGMETPAGEKHRVQAWRGRGSGAWRAARACLRVGASLHAHRWLTRADSSELASSSTVSIGSQEQQAQRSAGPRRRAQLAPRSDGATTRNSAAEQPRWPHQRRLFRPRRLWAQCHLPGVQPALQRLRPVRHSTAGRRCEGARVHAA